MDSLSYRFSIPGTDLHIGNDTPVWFKPRRTVWFVMRGQKIVTDKAGRKRYFPTAAKAAEFMERLNRETPASASTSAH
jgi:hypothetical protein